MAAATRIEVSELQGINRFKFHEGTLEEFKRLSARAMEITRAKDTGTLQYEVYFNDDQSECTSWSGTWTPRRSSSTARTWANSRRQSATGSVTSACLGEPSAELKALLAGSPVKLFTRSLAL